MGPAIAGPPAISSRFGRDFCYLSNPYISTNRLIHRFLQLSGDWGYHVLWMQLIHIYAFFD